MKNKVKAGVLGTLGVGCLLATCVIATNLYKSNAGLLGKSFENYKVDTLANKPFNAECYLLPAEWNTQVYSDEQTDGEKIQIYSNKKSIYNDKGTAILFDNVFDSGYDYLFVTDWSGFEEDIMISDTFYVPLTPNVTRNMYIAISSKGFIADEEATCSITLGDDYDGQFNLSWSTGYCGDFDGSDTFFSKEKTYSTKKGNSIDFWLDHSILYFESLEIEDKEAFFNRYKINEESSISTVQNESRNLNEKN